jgi:uncharacterized coiled-coil DUF342 family protein
VTLSQLKKKVDRLVGKAEELHAEIEELRDVATGYHEDKSEKWQESEAGAQYQTAIDELESIFTHIDESMQALLGFAEL